HAHRLVGGAARRIAAGDGAVSAGLTGVADAASGLRALRVHRTGVPDVRLAAGEQSETSNEGPGAHWGPDHSPRSPSPLPGRGSRGPRGAVVDSLLETPIEVAPCPPPSAPGARSAQRPSS